MVRRILVACLYVLGSALNVKHPFAGILSGGGLPASAAAASVLKAAVVKAAPPAVAAPLVVTVPAVPFTGQELGAGDARLRALFDFSCGTDAEFWVPGATPTACQLQCRDDTCSNAKSVCMKYACTVIAYNIPNFAAGRTDLYATLKKNVETKTDLNAAAKKDKNPMEGMDHQQVLTYVALHGWKSSKVTLSKDQRNMGTIATCAGFYNGNCNGNGENLLGRCFCFVGFTGADCSTALIKTVCTNKDDGCFYTSEAGTYAISFDRWKAAQYAEGATWALAGGAEGGISGDRVDDHMKDFNGYKSVGPAGTNLGTMIEVGAGPWTQSMWMMRRGG
jgi:hypothetical protein